MTSSDCIGEPQNIGLAPSGAHLPQGKCSRTSHTAPEGLHSSNGESRLGFSRNFRILCLDGFSLSIQDHEYSYSKWNSLGKITHVELGYLSSKPLTEDLMSYCQDSTFDSSSVFVEVPISLVLKELSSHGIDALEDFKGRNYVV